MVVGDEENVAPNGTQGAAAKLEKEEEKALNLVKVFDSYCNLRLETETRKLILADVTMDSRPSTAANANPFFGFHR